MRFILLAVLAITICSCKTKQADKVNFNKPESVMLAFFKALSEVEFTKAAEYSTEETKPLIDILNNISTTMSNVPPSVSKETHKEVYGNVKDVTCTDAGTDMKTCTVCCENTGEAFKAPLFVKKVNGKWLVHIPKDMPIDGETVPEEPVGN